MFSYILGVWNEYLKFNHIYDKNNFLLILIDIIFIINNNNTYNIRFVKIILSYLRKKLHQFLILS